MDTDYLTKKAYETILLSDSVIEFLPSELGVLCGGCKDEEEFLKKALEHIEEIEQSPNDYLEDWNYLDEIDVPTFVKGLSSLRTHVQKTLEMPLKKRGKPVF